MSGVAGEERHLTFRECEVPPEGWRCTRGAGHDGPCAAVRADKDALFCACSIHAAHGVQFSMCDQDCECWGGVTRVKVARSGRFADITYRVLLGATDV